jgi:CheY-like chemotaxis protein
MTQEMIDLDFTKAAPQSAAAPGGATAVDCEIGSLRAGHAGNQVCFVAGKARRVTALADSPVIVVEDDEITRRVLQRALTLQGYAVRAAADSREFLQALRKPPLPRLVLLDVELPKVNGLKLLTLLRQHPQTTDIPVLLLTGRSEGKDLLHGLSLGADGYLSKPVKLEMLRAVVQKLLH